MLLTALSAVDDTGGCFWLFLNPIFPICHIYFDVKINFDYAGTECGKIIHHFILLMDLILGLFYTRAECGNSTCKLKQGKAAIPVVK